MTLLNPSSDQPVKLKILYLVLFVVTKMTPFKKSNTLHFAKQKKGPFEGPLTYHLIKLFIIFYDF